MCNLATRNGKNPQYLSGRKSACNAMPSLYLPCKAKSAVYVSPRFAELLDEPGGLALVALFSPSTHGGTDGSELCPMVIRCWHCFAASDGMLLLCVIIARK